MLSNVSNVVTSFLKKTLFKVCSMKPLLKSGNDNLLVKNKEYEKRLREREREREREKRV